MTSKTDLNLMRVLVMLHGERSVTRTAHALGVSQSAVSMDLKRMRELLGDPLFVKVARGMAPTPRADALVAAIKPLLAGLEHHVQSSASFDAQRARRPFVFAMSDVGEMVFLPRLLERLRAAAPRAPIRSVSMPPRALERALETGEVDLAIGYFPDLRKDNFLEARLFSHYFSCLLRRDHPVVGRALSLEQFLALGHAVVRAEGRSQEIFEDYLNRRKIVRTIVLLTPHFMSLPMILARSDLIATVPHAMGRFFTSTSTNLKVVKPPFRVPDIHLKQHWHRKFHHDSRNRWLRGEIAALFNEATDEWSTRA